MLEASVMSCCFPVIFCGLVLRIQNKQTRKQKVSVATFWKDLKWSNRTSYFKYRYKTCLIRLKKSDLEMRYLLI